MLNIVKKIIGMAVIVVILGSIWVKSANSSLNLPLKLNKTATESGDKEFKIDLEVNGDGYEYKRGTDIIIVMDSSGSMANNPMEVLKKAVKNFSKEMLSREDTRISIIKFNGSTNLNSSGNGNDAKLITEGQNGFENNITNINTVVNNLEAIGGTNTQAAIKKINSQLVESKKSKPNSSRYVVFFTDGLPTTAIGKTVVEEKNEAMVKNYIVETQNEYNKINKDDVKFISIGLFRNITDESLRWQEKAADDLLNGIQNSGKFMINTEAGIEAIYDKIKQEIIKSSSIAKDVTLTDIVSSNFEIVDNSFEPKNIIPNIDKENNKVTWTISEIDTSGIKVSFKIRAKDVYYASDYEDTNIEANINYTDPKDNELKYDIFPVPNVTLNPVKGSITIIKEIDNNSETLKGDFFTIKLNGGKNNEEFNFNVGENTTTKVDFSLRDKGTINLIHPNYITIGEYDIREIIPMNYKLKEVYINGVLAYPYKFTIDKDNPSIVIKIVNKYDNDRYFTDKADKSNELMYDPEIGGPQ